MSAIRLKPRILWPFVLASMFLFAVFLFGVYHEENEHVDEEFGQHALTFRESYAALLRSHTEKMAVALAFLSRNEELKAAFAAKDRQRLLTLAQPLFTQLQQQFDVTHFYFHDTAQLNLLRVHEPSRFGDRIDRFTLLQAARTGALVAGTELGPLGTFTLRVVIPWHDGDRLLGYLELGEEVEVLLDELRHTSNGKAILLLDKQYLQQGPWEEGMRMLGREPRWDLLPQHVIAMREVTPEDTALLREQRVRDHANDGLWHVAGARYHAVYLPLQDALQRQVGELLMVHDVSPRFERLTAAILKFTTLSAGVGVLLFGLYYVILGRAERQMVAWQSQLTEESLVRAALQEQYITELERLALYDTLTGLPNRKLLQDRITAAMAAARDRKGGLALFLVDLHRLREINDTLGHAMGDLVLQQVGERLRRGLERADTVSRPGGDVFAILWPDAAADTIRTVIEDIHALLSEAVVVDGLPLDISASIGMVLYPEHGADASDLLRRADVALRHAKQRGRGVAMYAPQYDPHDLQRLALFGDLRKAIQQGDGLRLYYQPLFDMQTRRLAGAEVLARWHHHERGLVSPEEFIPLAEHTGLIRPFTHWVLEDALRQCSIWRSRGLEVAVAVNLSPGNLLDATVLEQVATQLARWQVAPHLLQLEITESAFMAEPERAMAVLRGFRDMGVGLVIDDFGTGYSSLSYLKHLPAQKLKIDRSFISDMLTDESDATIVKSTIALAHNLGLRVVAEGVKDQAIWDALVAQGCDIAQGYFVGRPMPVAEFESWVRTHGDGLPLNDSLGTTGTQRMG